MSHRATLQCLSQPPSYHSHSMTQSSAHSPMAKMPQPQRTSSLDSSGESIRKRVCKACDRCRLKKSKCDGSNPCTRCKQDNAICVFGERKKSHDKVYPKGYVEMLEQQQAQLVSGLQEMYKRLVVANAWTDAPLAETNGHPLTHDILASLDLLETKVDGSNEPEPFEEDCHKLQSRLLSSGAGYSHQRRSSFSSDSDHSLHSHAHSQSHGTPTMSKDFKFQNSAPSSPPAAPSTSPLQQRQSFPATQPSPLQHSSPIENDSQLYQNEWSRPEQDQKYMMQSDFAMQSPDLDQSLSNMGGMPGFGQWHQATSAPYNMSMSALSSYPQAMNDFGSVPRLQDGMLNGFALDPMQMDNDFLNFAQVQPA